MNQANALAWCRENSAKIEFCPNDPNYPVRVMLPPAPTGVSPTRYGQTIEEAVQRFQESADVLDTEGCADAEALNWVRTHNARIDCIWGPCDAGNDPPTWLRVTLAGLNGAQGYGPRLAVALLRARENEGLIRQVSKDLRNEIRHAIKGYYHRHSSGTPTARWVEEIERMLGEAESAMEQ